MLLTKQMENNKIKTWGTKKIKPKTHWRALIVFLLVCLLIFWGFCEVIRFGFRVEEIRQQEKYKTFEMLENALKEQRKVKISAVRIKPQYDDKMIIEAIITEAIGEPIEGIIAVASVFRNRLEVGMSLGACGLDRDNKFLFILVQPKWKKDLVRDIWQKVKVGQMIDPTDGALYFENTGAFGIPYWAKNKEIILEIGQHRFFK